MEYKEIKKLMDDMGNSKLTKFEIEFPDGVKISMKKEEPKTIVQEQQAPVVTMQAETQVVNQEVKAAVEPSAHQEQYQIITSPMVGTFYTKPSPTEQAFVKVGDKIKKGDTLCIIEAMKLMNEIESEFDGEIVEILVSDEEMVDYGKPLFKIKE